MNTLLLVTFLTVVGLFFAVPLFEFVFAALLIAPVFKLMFAKGLMNVGVTVEPGFPDAGLYLASFGLVFLYTYCFFGRRTKPIDKSEFYGIGVFALVFLVAYGLCLLWPDFIPMGERLRDYALLASSIDSPVVPKEPWMEGTTLNYYVFWYRFGGMLNSLLYIPTWDAYHTILSFSLAFYAAAIFQVVRIVFGGSALVALFMAIILPFGSNIAGVMGWKRGEAGGFEPDNGWWGPSRVIRGAIDEFPAWSFLLGDAHPHFLNLGTLPFFVLLLYRLLTSSADLEKRIIHGGIFVIAATGFLVGSNAWEVPMWLGIASMIGMVAWILARSHWVEKLLESVKTATRFDMIRAFCCVFVFLLGLIFAYKKFDRLSPATSIFILVLALGFSLSAFPYKSGIVGRLFRAARGHVDLVALSFWVLLLVSLKVSFSHISSSESGKLEFVREPVFFPSVAELCTHWGFHLFFISLASLLLFGLSLQTFFMAAFLGVSLLYEKAALFIYVLIGMQMLRLFTQRSETFSWRDAFTEAIAIGSLGLLLLPEVVFLNDSYGGENERMNTIFKIYTTDWGLLGLTAVALCLRVYDRYERDLEDSAPKLIPVCASVLGLIVLGASTQLYAHTVPMRKQRPGTDNRWSEGLTAPDRDNPGVATIVRVLRDKPKARVLEAQGNPYSYTGLVSTLASQPSYLGWANHVGLLTRKYDETGRRTKVTEEIYNGTDCQARKELARKEGIKYIVLGTLEKKKYQGVFDRDFGCFPLVTKDRDYWLFEVD